MNNTEELKWQGNSNSPYYHSFIDFKKDISALEELNEHLPLAS